MERPRPTRLRSARRARSHGLRARRTRRAPTLPAAAVALAVIVVVAGAWPVPAARAGVGDPGWRRPVAGAVVRPFVEPAGRYGPGHRGVDFAAPAGTPVLAAGRGTVVFAGPVAGATHVVVLHAGSVRTSYSYLLTAGVAVGDAVGAGSAVGTAGGGDPDGGHGAGVVHFGVRVGERYVDPMQLFRPRDLRDLVRLVPVDGDPGVGTSWARARVDEATTLLAGFAPHDGALTDDGGSAGGDGCGGGVPLVGAAVDVVCRGVAWAANETRDALRAGIGVLAHGGREARQLAARLAPELDALLDELARGAEALQRRLLDTPLGRVLSDVVEIGTRVLEWSRRECARGAPPADGTGGSGHLVMGVAGIDSRAAGPDRRSFGLDVAALGYHRDEVHWYSYAPDAGAYGASDTHGDLRAAAERLADQLRALHVAEPGREVDLIAHSQGGVVVERFLRFEYDASDPTFPPLGTVVTLASPHRGAPLATTGRELREHSVTGRVLDVAGPLLPGPPPDARSVRQLAEDSPFLRRMRGAPLPEHVDLTTIGGTDDLMVPANRIRVPGATEVVVAVDGPADHTAIHHDDRALRAVRAALERRPPPCTSLVEGLRAAVEPVLISRVEGDLGEYLTTYLEVGR